MKKCSEKKLSRYGKLLIQMTIRSSLVRDDYSGWLPALLLPLRGIRFHCVSRPKGRQTLCSQGIRTFFAWRKTCDADTARLCSIIDTMIFSEPRDPRFITIRRGGTLSDANHHLLALWAAECAEHVLPLFEAVQPS